MKWPKLHCTVAMLLTFGPVNAVHALPTGEEIRAGAATIERPDGSTLNIDQHTAKLIINWQEFGIPDGKIVNFLQQADDLSLNRVVGNDPSEIFGTLNAAGQVFLINQHGILFGESASVNVGGLIASTLELADEDFLNGNLNFHGGGGSVVNRGELTADEGGYIALLGEQVVNEGVIAAHLGSVALGAGERITLDMEGDELIQLEVDRAAVDALVDNQALIRTDGGRVLMSARTAGDLASTVVNNEGVVEAHSVVERDGQVMFTGDGSVAQHGSITVSGAQGSHAAGGRVDLHATGNLVHGTDARIQADGDGTADGGEIITWADGTNAFNSGAALSARGGTDGGDGGFVDVSGNRVIVRGGVDLSAPEGASGTLLIDPDVITITQDDVSDDGSTEESIISTTTISDFLTTANFILEAGDRIDSDEADAPTIVGGGQGNQLTLRLRGDGTSGQTRAVDLEHAVIDLGGDALLIDATDASEAPIHIHRVDSAATVTARTTNANIELHDNASVTGAILLEAGADIAQHDGVDVSSDVANGAGVTFRADGSIETENGSITTQGGDIILNADRDASEAGLIEINGTTLVSDGGDITLGGGADPGSSAAYGVEEGDWGVRIRGGATVDAGAGGIRIRGHGADAGGEGVWISTVDTRLTAADGIEITGTGTGEGSSRRGVLVSDGAEIVATGTGDISIVGTGAGRGGSEPWDVPASNTQGIRVTGTSSMMTRITSESGAINLDGTSGCDQNCTGLGVQISLSGADGKISSTSGDITITGRGATAGSDNLGVEFAQGVISSNEGDLYLEGEGRATDGSGNHGIVMGSNSELHAAGRTVTLTSLGGAIEQDGSMEAANLLVRSLGDVNLDGDANEVDTLAADNGSGDAIPGDFTFVNQGELTIGTVGGVSGIAATGDVALTSSGGDLSVDSVSVSTTGGAIQFRADGSIETENGSITTEGGDIILNADRDASEAGSILISGTTLASSGGAITLGGGNDPLATPAYGTGTGITDRDGVRVYNDGKLDAGGGAISLRGVGYDTDFARGVILSGDETRVTSSGDITVVGVGTGTDNYRQGVSVASGARVIATSDGAIVLTGTGAGAGGEWHVGAHNHGVNVSGPGSRVSSESGQIHIDGTAECEVNCNYNRGVVVDDEAQIESVTGDIRVEGTGPAPGSERGGSDGEGIFIGNASVATSDGEIRLEGVGRVTSSGGHGIRMESDGEVAITGTGDLIMEGTGANNADALRLEGEINAAGRTVTLTSLGGAIEQDGSMEAANLLVRSLGDVNLDGDANEVDTLAADNGSGDAIPGDFTFVNQGELTIGTVGGVSGIAATGDVVLAANGLRQNDGPIHASNLLVRSQGDVNLDGDANEVDTLAADNGSGDAIPGDFTFVNQGELTIGTLGGVSGISATGNVVLAANGLGQDNGPIQAAHLLVRSQGDVDLSGGANEVNTLAADNGSGDAIPGDFTFVNQGNLTVGDVLGVSGVSATGDVDISAQGGQVTYPNEGNDEDAESTGSAQTEMFSDWGAGTPRQVRFDAGTGNDVQTVNQTSGHSVAATRQSELQSNTPTDSATAEIHWAGNGPDRTEELWTVEEDTEE